MSGLPLTAFALFHLNLNFSAIEEAQRDDVIARCYRPLLDLAEHDGIPVALEASGWTLEEIARRDPLWLARARALAAQGRIELVGAGYAQAIGPLMPAAVTAANLAHGHRVYEALMGLRPALALVNEQAYSGGLVPLYVEAGYRGLLMDWDNCASFHAAWDPTWRFAPQIALGPEDSQIPLLWTNTIAFQKLQRLAHGDIPLADYIAYVAAQRGAGPRLLALYGNDAECFDFRPGRFATEERLGTESEWRRIAHAFAALRDQGLVRFVRPTEALAPGHGFPPPQRLRLETARNPVPVKKQPKYNVTRWAVTGRDDLGINTACWRAYQALRAAGLPTDAPEWRELCAFWASDFRTHITARRWEDYRARLDAFLRKLTEGMRAAEPLGLDWTAPALRAGRWLDLETRTLRATLDARRGLAVDSLAFAPDFRPLVGGLRHGCFDDIALSADWYTGNAVFEAPGQPKVTDLERVAPELAHDPGTDDLHVRAIVPTPLGAIVKDVRLAGGAPRLDLAFRFEGTAWTAGVLRLGHVTLKPEAFDLARLVCRTHNGGRAPETFALDGQVVDHGAPVSFLVSAASALGLTEGWAELGDGRRGIRVTVDKTAAAVVGLLVHRPAGGCVFCQLVLSARELDDTRRPEPAAGPLEVRLSLTPAEA